jgi:hypothetical protein
VLLRGMCLVATRPKPFEGTWLSAQQSSGEYAHVGWSS